MDKTVRGTSLVSMAHYIDRLDDNVKAAIQKELPDNLLEKLRTVTKSGFYPVEHANALQHAIASTYSDPVEAYEGFIYIGRQIASEALNNVLRLLVKFMTPALFARKFGDFFRRDHTFGQVDVDQSEVDERRLVLHMSDVGGYEYVAPVATGWMLQTLEAMGCKQVHIRETLSPPPGPQDVDRYRFEISWN